MATLVLTITGRHQFQFAGRNQYKQTTCKCMYVCVVSVWSFVRVLFILLYYGYYVATVIVVIQSFLLLFCGKLTTCVNVLSKLRVHTHTHTHTYVCVYMCVCVCSWV